MTVMEQIEAKIAAVAAMPHTHRVRTTFACGAFRDFTTRNAASAETHAIGERRKIGRKLIVRETGATVAAVSVEVSEITATVQS